MKFNMMDYKKIIEKLKPYSKKRSVKLLIPFVLFVFGGSLGLREFTTLRYEYRQVKRFDEVLEQQNLKRVNPEESSLEAQYEKIKDIDTSDWESARIPRPYED